MKGSKIARSVSLNEDLWHRLQKQANLLYEGNVSQLLRMIIEKYLSQEEQVA